MTDQDKTALLSKPRAPVADTLSLEKALYELVNKIDTGLDTGDLVQDARRASTVLDAIMASGDLVACAHEFFKDCGEDKWRDRYERSIDFRIGWNACLDAIAEARSNRASAPVAGEAQPVALVEVSVPHLRSISVKIIPDAPMPNVGDLLYAAPQASEAVRDVNHPVFAFLLGEGPLRGVHFGDRHPDERGAYWWRKDLRAALSAQPGAQNDEN